MMGAVPPVAFFPVQVIPCYTVEVREAQVLRSFHQSKCSSSPSQMSLNSPTVALTTQGWLQALAR